MNPAHKWGGPCKKVIMHVNSDGLTLRRNRNRNCVACEVVQNSSEYRKAYAGTERGRLTRVLKASRSNSKINKDSPLDVSTLPPDWHLITQCQSPGCSYKFTGTNKRLCVDHNHATGAYVAMLCSKHNSRIEGYRDPELATRLTDEEACAVMEVFKRRYPYLFVEWP